MPLTLTLTNAVLTAYCACSVCCGAKHAARGITAAGTRPTQGVTIAASRRIPLGSRVKIGTREFVVQDRLARRFDGRFDLFFARHEDAVKFGRKDGVTLTIIPAKQK